MVENINLKELEKKAYKSTFQDGLWDLYFGLLFLGIGISPLLKQLGLPKPWYYFAIPIPAFLVLWAGKKYITIPRIGMVKFGARRESNKKKMRIILAIVLAVTAIVLLLTIARIIPQLENSYAGPIGIAVFFMIVFWVMAYYMDFSRLYYIAVLFAVSIPLAEILYDYVGTPLDGLIAFGSSGTIISIIGSIFLRRFLKKYPKPTDDLTMEGVEHGSR